MGVCCNIATRGRHFRLSTPLTLLVCCICTLQLLPRVPCASGGLPGHKPLQRPAAALLPGPAAAAIRPSALRQDRLPGALAAARRPLDSGAGCTRGGDRGQPWAPGQGCVCRNVCARPAGASWCPGSPAHPPAAARGHPTHLKRLGRGLGGLRPDCCTLCNIAAQEGLPHLSVSWYLTSCLRLHD